jgi:hypothetical protein
VSLSDPSGAINCNCDDFGGTKKSKCRHCIFIAVHVFFCDAITAARKNYMPDAGLMDCITIVQRRTEAGPLHPPGQGRQPDISVRANASCREWLVQGL